MRGVRNTRLLAIATPLLLISTVSRADPCVPAGTGDRQAATANVAAPSYLSAWEDKYPSSTLPARMSALTGSACSVCHHPSAFGDPGNCYRADLITLLVQGLTIEQAIDQLDAVDSDGDGTPNGEEAVAPRPEVGEIGYNMGLIGATGTDPCATNPAEPVSGISETPPDNSIPTVSQWGLVVFVIVQAIAGTLILRRREPFGGRVHSRP